MENISQSTERQPNEEDIKALQRAIARVGIVAARETLELVAAELTEGSPIGESSPMNGGDELDDFDTSQELEKDFVPTSITADEIFRMTTSERSSAWVKRNDRKKELESARSIIMDANNGEVESEGNFEVTETTSGRQRISREATRQRRELAQIRARDREVNAAKTVIRSMNASR